MATRTSAAALYAAHVLFEHYRFAVRPPDQVRAHRFDNLQATEVHVAIFIDHKTGVRELALLRPKITYWQTILATGANDAHTAAQLAFFFREVLEVLDRIPRYPEEERPREVTCECITTTGAWTVRMKLSRAALEAMETLYYYYDLQPLKPPVIYDEAIERVHVTKLIDSCIAIKKPLQAIPMLRAGHQQLLRGQASADDIAKCMRLLGILFEFLPNYDDHRDEAKLLA